MAEPDPNIGATKKLDALYEYDREPVAKDKLAGGSYFAGLFAGEHVAATEFVIGALFVSWGARPIDVIVGLLLGNLMAVLSWAFVCAPIATRTRLTLYWYLRKVGGPDLSFLYNMLNAIMFCVLGGCMITVAASAVRIPLGIMEPQTGWLPTDWKFVPVVLLVGAVVTLIAILGFKSLARFATVCAPWMLLMFVAGAFVMLPALGRAAGVGDITSFGEFWEVAKAKIWVGRTPDGGPPLVGFWEVAAFAWVCNLAMHIGLADMALFRYAKKWTYGFYSSFGMLLGHYAAWICAGIMGAGAALALNEPVNALDSGAVAVQALGWMGVLAVVIAGWTTSNPTIYRAGLAFQAVTPNWPRWKVTMYTGIATTIIACSPFVFQQLLNFVGIYGLMLMPIGAVLTTEHWILPRVGLPQYWAEKRKIPLNWPALATWVFSLFFAATLGYVWGMHLFFLFLPTYFFAVVTYIACSCLAVMATKDLEPAGEAESQAASSGGEEAAPKPEPKPSPAALGVGTLALLALVACVVLPIRVFLLGQENYEENLASFKTYLIFVTIVYFIAGTAYAVMRDKEKEKSKSEG